MKFDEKIVKSNFLTVQDNFSWNPVFDDDKGKNKNGDSTKSDGGDKNGDKNSPKTFTQEEVNKLLAKDKKKFQENQRSTIEELEALKAKSTMTTEDRKELENRIEGMKDELLTKEELSSKEKMKTLTAHKTAIAELQQSRDDWKNRFDNSTIARSITDAAHTEKAYTSDHILAILKPVTRMTEDLDADGKPNGKFSPKVKFQDTDKDNKPVLLDLTPIEAVKRMKEIKGHQVLFKGTGVGGFGGSTTTPNGDLDVKKAATDAKSYREKRKNGEIDF